MSTTILHNRKATSVPVPTSPANRARIDEFFKNEDFRETVFALSSRWACEREFEDINDYGKVISSNLPEGFKLMKMTKKPFGFHFSIGTEAVYHYKVTARSVSWSRIA
jgi:hypothetical protein